MNKHQRKPHFVVQQSESSHTARHLTLFHCVSKISWITKCSRVQTPSRLLIQMFLQELGAELGLRKSRSERMVLIYV